MNFASILLHRHELTWDDFPVLSKTFFASVGFWSLVYAVSYTYKHKFDKNCKNYHNLPSGEQALYLSRVSAMIHAFFAFVLATIFILYTWYQ